LGSWHVNTLIFVINTWEKQFKRRKDLFLAHSFRAVHQQSAFWACGKAEHHGRRLYRSIAAYLVAARKQKDTNRREPRARYPSKACPQ
jgi:hypothetical protein